MHVLFRLTLWCPTLLARKPEDANTSRTDQLAQVRGASWKLILNVTLYRVTNLVESVTTTWSRSLSCSIPWMPELDRFWSGTSPHNVYPSYSAAMLDEKNSLDLARIQMNWDTGTTRLSLRRDLVLRPPPKRNVTFFFSFETFENTRLLIFILPND